MASLTMFRICSSTKFDAFVARKLESDSRKLRAFKEREFHNWNAEISTSHFNGFDHKKFLDQTDEQ